MGVRKFDSWIAGELEKLDAVAELSIIFPTMVPTESNPSHALAG